MGDGSRSPIEGAIIIGFVLTLILILILVRTWPSPKSALSPEFPKPQMAIPPPPADNWIMTPVESKMDDSKGIVIGVFAISKIKGWLTETLPELAIRCQEHRTEVFIHTGLATEPEYGEDRFTGRVRFDDLPAQTLKWGESSSKEALFAESPIPLARQIAKSKRLRFEFTPFNSSPQIAEFNLSGAAPHVKAVADACKWSLKEPVAKPPINEAEN